MNDQFYRPQVPVGRTIELRHFWLIKIILIVLIVGVSAWTGYMYGIRRIEIAQQFGHDAALAEYPTITYEQSGITFCYDRGNIWPAELVPTKRALRPLFKAKKQ